MQSFKNTVVKRRGRWGALVIVGALLVTACSNSGDDASGTSTSAATDKGGGSDEFVSLKGVPGVSDEEIRFAAFGTQANNPLGTCVLDCYVQGIKAYFAFRNSEGGVQGRQMVLSTVLDDELSNNQQRALEITSANDTFAAFSATQIPSGWPTIVDAGMPLYTWSIHPAEAEGQESIFGYAGAGCTTCTSRILPYAGTLVDATTVAGLGYGVSPNSAQCARGVERSVKKYAGETGQSVGYINDDLAFGLPNGIGPEVTAMRDAGVDFIVACIDINGVTTLAQELERQGLGDIPIYHLNTYNQSHIKDNAELFEGDIVVPNFRPFEADPAGSQLADYLEWMAETGSETSELSMYGWINADTAYQGLVEAGGEFDRASVIAATNQLTDYSAGGLINPIDFTRQHVSPTQEDPVTNGPLFECAVLMRVVSGTLKTVGDPATPFICFDGTNRDWAEPKEMTFG